MKRGGRPKQLHEKRSPEARAAAIDKVWQSRVDDLWAALDASRQIDAQQPELDAKMDRDLKALGPQPSIEEFQRVLEARQRAEKAHWKVFREVEHRRDEQDGSDQLPFGDRAMERLRGYRSRRDEILRTHGERSTEYETFMRGTFVPWYNVASTEDRMCERCFILFALTDARARFCSSNCSAAKRMRGREHDGRSRNERSVTADLAKWEAHVRTCTLCGNGQSDSCRTYTRLQGRVDVQTRAAPPEVLEAISERRGR